MQRDHLSSIVDRDDIPPFPSLNALAEEPRLHESVADQVEVTSQLELPVSAVIGVQLFVI